MKRLATLSLVLTAMVVLLSGCNCHNKMAKKADGIKVTVTPQVLVLKGTNVTADVTVTFPPQYVAKKTVLRITPVLAFEGGEIVGTPKYVQGEKVQDNYTVISKRNGGSYTQTVTFPYDERADVSTLKLVFDAHCGCNKDEYLPVTTKEVALGVNTIARKADWASFLAVMPDNFKRVTHKSYDADLMYLINSSQVRNVALSAEQIKMFEQFIKDAEAEDRTTLTGVHSKGYASPDGAQKFNDALSKARSESAKKAVGSQIKKQGLNVNIDAAPYGEDWEGFKALVEASNMPDKNLILSVLNMYSSPVQREEQIKNMSQVFEVLKKDILPQLRRAQLVANADVQGKTDAELRAAVTNNLNSLNVEEMLFAATLVDNKDAVRIYKAAYDKYNDVRALNNYAVALVRDGQLKEGARIILNDLPKLSNAPEVTNNQAVMTLVESNDPVAARRFVGALSGEQARATQGLIALVEGDYATATRSLNGYNLAVAEIANNNISGAKTALGNLETANADYVRAIISMREGNPTAALNSLNSAFHKDPNLRATAKRDIEFYSIFDKL